VRALRPDDEAGSATLELALITPVLLAFLLLVVTLGRLGSAREDIDGAAAQAARAASIALSPAQARSAAYEAASAAVAAQSLLCETLDVSVDTASFRPGGQVAVEVVCTVGLGRLSGVGLPGSRVLNSRAVEVIDTFRGQP
jgi:Flp pilus assembly protein TadG